MSSQKCDNWNIGGMQNISPSPGPTKCHSQNYTLNRGQKKPRHVLVAHQDAHSKVQHGGPLMTLIGKLDPFRRRCLDLLL